MGLPLRGGLKGREGDCGAYMKAIQTRLGGLRVWDSIRVLAVARRAGVRGVPLRYYYALYIVPDKKKNSCNIRKKGEIN